MLYLAKILLLLCLRYGIDIATWKLVQGVLDSLYTVENSLTKSNRYNLLVIYQ